MLNIAHIQTLSHGWPALTPAADWRACEMRRDNAKFDALARNGRSSCDDW